MEMKDPSHFPKIVLNRFEMNARGGCQCKLAGCDLETVLSSASGMTIPGKGPARLEAEDCGILTIGDDSLVLTTDLIPVVGIDLFVAGRISALHSMSDVYASGCVPFAGLVNLVVDEAQPITYAEAVLAGTYYECGLQRVALLGGHTLIGREALIGLTVVGRPLGKRVLRKRGAVIGDDVLLSKPLGVGIVLRGYKLGLCSSSELEGAVTVMTTSNAGASEAAVTEEVHACSDVSGFGLLGHLVEMLDSGMGVEIRLSEVPVLSGIAAVPSQLRRTVWVENNLNYALSRLSIEGSDYVDDRTTPLLDPQTNGGLLVCASRQASRSLQGAGFRLIGSITGSGAIRLV